jgi:hypothetical protein
MSITGKPLQKVDALGQEPRLRRALQVFNDHTHESGVPALASPPFRFHSGGTSINWNANHPLGTTGTYSGATFTAQQYPFVSTGGYSYDATKFSAMLVTLESTVDDLLMFCKPNDYPTVTGSTGNYTITLPANHIILEPNAGDLSGITGVVTVTATGGTAVVINNLGFTDPILGVSTYDAGRLRFVSGFNIIRKRDWLELGGGTDADGVPYANEAFPRIRTAWLNSHGMVSGGVAQFKLVHITIGSGFPRIEVFALQ